MKDPVVLWLYECIRFILQSHFLHFFFFEIRFFTLAPLQVVYFNWKILHVKILFSSFNSNLSTCVRQITAERHNTRRISFILYVVVHRIKNLQLRGSEIFFFFFVLFWKTAGYYVRSRQPGQMRGDKKFLMSKTKATTGFSLIFFSFNWKWRWRKWQFLI